MTLGTMTQAYGEPSYWDNRHAQEPGPFDWYQKYPALAPLLHLYIPTHHRLLVVGCGTSAFSEGMVDDGYVDVVNIDISSVAIEAIMRKKCSNRPQLKYIKMDVRDMSAFQTVSFDAVVDKGTLDSLLEVIHDQMLLRCLRRLEDYIWSANLSLTLVEKFIVMYNKTPFDRKTSVRGKFWK
ncbi:Methyltransferase-like protein [Actinidia chinensis var. chinensis]|uniref:Methyltransferase-like protein n=1 Tax=Actinidia chinensis var. chinensis TaxID=1590841 RepID=A0A2R6PJE7_ACTCC|nr:Methyltransferase-like protein [Actinidia chinensis var. chinensis]